MFEQRKIQPIAQPTTARAAYRITKLFLAGLIVAAIILATVATENAKASGGSVAVDSDGYVPIYSSCSAADWSGSYNWYFDGYAGPSAKYVK